MHSQLAGGVGLIGDKLGVFTRVKAGIEFVFIQSKVSGKSLEFILVEGTLVFTRLVFEQKVVIFPKGILVTGTFRGFGRPERFFPQEGEVEVAKTNFTCIYVSGLYLTTRVSGKTPAVGSLKIAELDDRDRGVGITFEMGGVADEVSHELFLVADGGEGCIRGRCASF